MREGRDIVKMGWFCVRKSGQGRSGNKISAYLDDHSRFVPGATDFEDDPTTEHALKLFTRCGKKYRFGTSIDRPRTPVLLCR